MPGIAQYIKIKIIDQFFCRAVVVMISRYKYGSELIFRLLLRTLSDEQYQDVLNVCSSFPHLEVDVKTKGKWILKKVIKT